MCIACTRFIKMADMLYGRSGPSLKSLLYIYYNLILNLLLLLLLYDYLMFLVVQLSFWCGHLNF